MTLMSEGPRFSNRDIWPRVCRNPTIRGAGKFSRPEWKNTHTCKGANMNLRQSVGPVGGGDWK